MDQNCIICGSDKNVKMEEYVIADRVCYGPVCHSCRHCDVCGKELVAFKLISGPMDKDKCDGCGQ